jgi:hypothetical protein
MNRIINDRIELGDLANDLGFTTAVEIGTHQGVFADGFLSKFKGTLSCVDPWSDPSPPPHATFLPAFVWTSPGRQFDADLAQFVLHKKYPDRVVFFQMKSLDFAATLADESQEFIYIDGLHDIPNVKADILAFWPKLKPGGILAGHDYVFGDPRAVGDIALFGVAAAVNWFAVENGLDLKVTNESISSWYFQKPKP